MKVAIASDDGKIISSHFGRTKGFAIYGIEGTVIKTQAYLENTFTGHARGLEGADHGIDRHGPILEALKDCQVVISHGMGRRIYDDLESAGIEVFVTDETDVQKAVNLFINDKLINNTDLVDDHKHIH